MSKCASWSIQVQRQSCMNWFTRASSILFLFSLTAAAFAAPPDKGMGINLTHHRYYSASIPFVDAFKKSDPWRVNKGSLNLTEDGWIASLEPGQVARTIMLKKNGSHPSGIYNIFFEGDGEIKLGGDASVIDRKPGHIRADVRPSVKGIHVKIKATNPDDPIRNIAVILPGFEDVYKENPFNPAYLNLVRKFRVARFMDWMRTSNTKVVSWDDRTRMSYATQDLPSGIAPEYIIDFANTAGVHPWITIPHKADDDYVRQLAKLYRARLNPELKVYIEYSNEVWNGVYDHLDYMREAAPSVGDKTKSGFLSYYSHRSVQIFDIWEEVFQGTNRLIRVIAGQASRPYTGKKALAFNDAYKKTDAYAIAPYISLGKGFDKSNTSTDYLLGVLNKRLEEFVEPKLKESIAMAKAFGVPVIAYEGGQHVTGQTKSGEHRCTAVNRDVGMGELYSKYLSVWADLTDNNLFVHFNDISTPSEWGCWGMMERMSQPPSESPKLNAILKHAESVTNE